MSALIDCPICMDCIESTTKNCVTTECGHCFHASCLMTSVAHTGFNCPYCRSKMAEEAKDDEETVYTDVEEEYDMFDENALRGFRFFFNNLNGESHDTEDDEEEDLEDKMAEETEEEDPSIPSASFVAQKLQQQGVSYEQLVKIIMLQHEEYVDDEEAERLDDTIFGKIRIIVSNYTPEQAGHIVQVDGPVPQSVKTPVVVPDVAEPKVYFRQGNRFHMHV